MPNEFKKYRCGLCGSVHVKINEGGLGTCPNCGAEFVYQDGCYKIRIMPEKDERESLRKVLIRLACENVPDDFFDECEIKDVTTVGYQVTVVYFETKIAYSIESGKNWYETYEALETYYEDEPYQTTDLVYDQKLRKNVKVAVTKFRKVKKERVVTKRRKHTDWERNSSGLSWYTTLVKENRQCVCIGTYVPSASDVLQGEKVLNGASDNAVGKTTYAFFDKDVFIKCLKTAKGESADVPSKSECSQLKANMSALLQAEKKHTSELNSAAEDALLALKKAHKADEYRNERYDYMREVSAVYVYLVPEYIISFSYKGKNYKKYVFPFGDDNVAGDTVKNKEDPDSYKKEKMGELEAKRKKEKQMAEDSIFNRYKLYVFLATAFLSLSIVCSVLFALLLPIIAISLPVVLTVFAVSVILYCVSMTKGENREKISEYLSEGTSQTASEKFQEEVAVAEDINNYYDERRQQKLEKLNARLKALGLDPADIREIR